jgi:hypothetical protein
MNKQKLEYFHDLLTWQRQQATEDLRAYRTTALKDDDCVEDIGEVSEFDLNRSAVFACADRESHLIQDIDDALGRLKTAPMASAFVVASHCMRNDSKQCQLLSTVRNVRLLSRQINRSKR